MSRKKTLDELGKSLLRYPNVTGYAKTLQKRIRKGKVVDELCLQVHVTKKVPVRELRVQDVIPSVVEDIPIDVVEVHEIKYYYWHKQLHPLSETSTCPVSKAVASALNAVSKMLHRKTRFAVFYEAVNHIDFGVAKMITLSETRFYGFEIDIDKHDFVGFGFAGSDIVSLHCKQKYVTMEGYEPIMTNTIEAWTGDVLIKSGRSCFSKAKVLLDSCFEIVNYGAYKVAFDDVIMTEHMLVPGDSGSSIWKEME